jgi:hypothetical protein
MLLTAVPRTPQLGGRAARPHFSGSAAQNRVSGLYEEGPASLKQGKGIGCMITVKAVEGGGVCSQSKPASRPSC